MKTKHFAQLVALSALWGASFMLIRLASPVLGPNVLAALRIATATATLAVLMHTMHHNWPRGHWRELALIGLLSDSARSNPRCALFWPHWAVSQRRPVMAYPPP